MKKDEKNKALHRQLRGTVAYFYPRIVTDLIKVLYNLISCFFTFSFYQFPCTNAELLLRPLDGLKPMADEVVFYAPN